VKIIQARNVNDAYLKGWQYLESCPTEDTRNGPAFVSPQPVVTEYENSTERVLFDRRRKANPFFHLFESMWMLAGRDDSDFLNHFVHDFGDRYAQSDGSLWGAYGYRWCNHFGFHQLERIVEVFQRDPHTRQAVLTMWSPKFDLSADSDYNEPIKDRPCNTHIYFRNNNDSLDMTVCCRSNDMIWGAYGANMVHMSILQEYMASQLNMSVGTYYQISNNFHAYKDTWNKIMRPAPFDPYASGLVEPYEMWTSPTDAVQFMNELPLFLNQPMVRFTNRFIDTVLRPMWIVHGYVRSKRYDDAMHYTADIAALDWRLAAQHYIEHRMSPA
jgi:thymidylate synthase